MIEGTNKLLIPSFDYLLNNYLKKNNGIIIIKFSAEWCNPCKKIENLFKILNEELLNYDKQNLTQTLIIDVDDNFELYGYFKSKKMINGIPVILCFYKNNISYVPDDVVIGIDKKQITLFFERCKNYLNKI